MREKFPLKGIKGALPETVVTALISASDEVGQHETWTAPRRGGATAVVPRIISIISASRNTIGSDSKMGLFVRQNTLRILAYLPADLRLSALIDLASRNPEALDDIICGKINPSFESYRYNIISSLGVFARHGLVEEVFTQERVERVSGIMGDLRRPPRLAAQQREKSHV